MDFFDRFVGAGINAKVAQARKDPNALIVDVRTPQEFARGHIEGSVNVPLDRIGDGLERFRGRRLYVMCASGARAKRAVAELKRLGMDDAESIGGIMSWRGPLTQGA